MAKSFVGKLIPLVINSESDHKDASQDLYDQVLAKYPKGVRETVANKAAHGYDIFEEYHERQPGLKEYAVFCVSAFGGSSFHTADGVWWKRSAQDPPILALYQDGTFSLQRYVEFLANRGFMSSVIQD